MACDIATGRSIICKDSQGGLAFAGFINGDDLPYSAITYDTTETDMVASVSGTPDLYKYLLGKASGSITATPVVSDENGTTYFDTVVSLTFPKLTPEDQRKVKLLAYGSPKIVLGDNINNYFLVGAKKGCTVTGGTITTGTAQGDLNGYTLEFTASEATPFQFIDATSEADLTTAGFVIT